MAAEYMHIGIPVLNKKPNMVYNEWGGFWVNESVDEEMMADHATR